MRGDIDLSRRSSSLSSSRIGDYECREDEVLGEGRRRHIVRSGGRHGTEILSTYQRGLDEDPTFRIRKRPREEFHLAQPSLQERLAKTAVVELAERCKEALQVHSAARGDWLRSDFANELAHSNNLMDIVSQAALAFLANKDAWEAAKTQPSLPASDFSAPFPVSSLGYMTAADSMNMMPPASWSSRQSEADRFPQEVHAVRRPLTPAMAYCIDDCKQRKR